MLWALMIVEAICNQGACTFREVLEYLDREWEIAGRLPSKHRDAFRYWLRKLLEGGFMKVVGRRGRARVYGLTGLGKWLSESLDDYREFQRRFGFGFSGVCRECSTLNRLVLRRPVLKTLFVSRRGILNGESICPQCGSKGYYCVHNIYSVEMFLSLYKGLASELGRFYQEVVWKPPV